MFIPHSEGDRDPRVGPHLGECAHARLSDWFSGSGRRHRGSLSVSPAYLLSPGSSKRWLDGERLHF